MERLQKVIANHGVCSRRKAEVMIEEGRVKVNGKMVKELGTKVSGSDVILIDNKPLPKFEKVYYVLYKPEGYISTTEDEHDRPKVIDLIDTKERIFPVGRLDWDTSGVLILTNDGEFTNTMIHPSHKLEKEYEVTMSGLLRKESSHQIERGVMIDGVKTKRARIRNVEYNSKKTNTKCVIVITEGRYHQVKKMFEAFGHEVTKLKRTRFGVVTLDGLRKGEYRYLKPHEMKQLYHYAIPKDKK